MKKCCPPGRGCNLQTNLGTICRGGEGCLQNYARKNCKDEESIEEMIYAWNNYLHTKGFFKRRRAHKSYRWWIVHCYEQGMEKQKVYFGDNPQAIELDPPSPPWVADKYGPLKVWDKEGIRCKVCRDNPSYGFSEINIKNSCKACGGYKLELSENKISSLSQSVKH